jgi:hypothetical protein
MKVHGQPLIRVKKLDQYFGAFAEGFKVFQAKPSDGILRYCVPEETAIRKT